MSALNGQDIDLAELDTKAGANEGFWLTLRHPISHRPLVQRLRLLGADSDRYQQKLYELQRRRQQELASGAAERLSPEDIHARAVELVAAVTAGWDALKFNGEDLRYEGEASAAKLYRDFPWVYEQANLAVVQRANFLPGSAKS